jgi:hypothetical protein
MNESTHPPARPQSVGAVIRVGFRIFGATLPGGLFYGAAFAIVQLLPSIYREIWAPRVFGLRATAPGVWIVYAVCGLVTLVLFAAANLRQAAVAGGEGSSASGVLRAAFSKLLRLALLTITTGVIVISLGEFLIPLTRSESMSIRVAADLLVLAALYWLVAGAFAWPAVALLGCRAFDAIVCSVRLVRSNWWGSFVVLLLAWIVLLVCLAAGQVVSYLWPFTASGELLGMTAAAVVVSIVINAIGFPLISALIVARFGDLRTRESTAGVATEGRLVPV